MTDYSDLRPITRRDGLIIEELPGELLVYDVAAQRAHCLNRSAAAIFQACDGTRTVSEVAVLASADGMPLDSQAVLLGLRRLQSAQLLASEMRLQFDNEITRRALIKRLAAGTATTLIIPAITSVPVQAQESIASCAPEGECVEGLNDCAPCFNGSGRNYDKNQCLNKRCWQGRCRPGDQTPCT